VTSTVTPGFSSSKASTIVCRFSSLPALLMKFVYVMVTSPSPSPEVAVQPVRMRAAAPARPAAARNVRFMVRISFDGWCVGVVVRWMSRVI
jgi:hypothetical protein